MWVCRPGGIRHDDRPWHRAIALLLVLLTGAAGARAADAQAAAPALLLPSAIAYDAAGNLFIVDTDRNQVLESTLGGALIVAAGSGVQGFGGDGGPAAAALLNAPRSLAFGPDGTLYIADTANQRIRAITAGVIRTFAGNGTRGFSGDGGPATAASFALPSALAVDANGALLICDTDNQRVRRISGGIVATVAGSGVEGFAGDAGPATAAEFNSPQGIAVAGDGRILVADSRNHRIRVVLPSGIVGTFAGTGVAGISGDGGPAASAQLALPQGLFFGSNGQLLFADTDNHRVRSIDANGTISTIAGSGTQGAPAAGSTAATASLNEPQTVAATPLGWPVLVDAPAHAIWVASPGGTMYFPAGMASGRASQVSFSAPAAGTYGQGSASVGVRGAIGTPQGQVSLADGQTPLASTALAAGAGTLSLSGLSAGSHTLVAIYGGDGLNPAASSSPVGVVIAPAPLIAIANAATMPYGAALPALTGTLAGILPQDAASLTATFTAAATPSSPVGEYPIRAALSGSSSGNYALGLSSASGDLRITPAPTTISVRPVTQNAYAGMPLLLSANVVSATPAAASGTVQFSDGGSNIAQGVVQAGVASAAYLAPAAGTHAIVATFNGGPNFGSSASSVLQFVVSPMPDFDVGTSGSSTATVQAGTVASYSVVVASQPGPFTGDVVLSVRGLPAGATASFSPPQLVPGAGSATSTLSIQTQPLAAATAGGGVGPWAWVLALGLGILPAFGRRRRFWRDARGFHQSALAVLAVFGALLAAGGCGARNVVVTSQPAATSYALTVTGTSTDLAGVVVTHTAAISLKLE